MTWRRPAADCSFVAMEALYLFAAGNLIAGVMGGSGPGLLAILAAAFAGFWLARFLTRWDVSARTLALVGTAMALVGLWLIGLLEYGDSGPVGTVTAFLDLARDPQKSVDGHAVEFAGIAILGVAWLRGSLDGMRSPIEYRAVLRSFAIGLAVIVIGLSFGRAAEGSRAIDRAALPFFVVGLISLALAHAAQSNHMQGDSWRGPWALVLVGSAALIGAVGFVLGLVPLDLLNVVLAPAGSLLLAVLDIVVFLIALPIALAINWVLVHALSGNRAPFQPNLRMASDLARNLQHPAHRSGLALAAIFVAKALLFLAIVGGAMAVIWWTYQKLRRRGLNGVESREPLEHDSSLRGDIAGLLANWRGRFGRGPAEDAPLLPQRILSLRRLYLGMLHRAAADGLERPVGTTPREFAPALEEHFNGGEADQLSHRFSAGRYGRVEPSDADLLELERSLKRLQS